MSVYEHIFTRRHRHILSQVDTSACCFARSRLIFSPLRSSSFLSSPLLSVHERRRRRRYRRLYLFTPCTCPGWMARARRVARRVASHDDNARRYAIASCKTYVKKYRICKIFILNS